MSVIIGKLGTGKTLLLTYLLQVIKLLTDKIYSNYPLEDDKVKVLTFKNLDFTDRTKPVPPDDSVILFDESYLYIDETSPHDEKKVHSGKITVNCFSETFW
ncbi:Spiroplasmavirus-related protein [Spiroplasma kunkelii CR2-3x]|uniref:Spiroplasmavirus-related protein n=1 Tax=Spiroplasma kunkelii CR2-3x TaxID=273035 RepID=A0A0K2JHD4_SPIKU|nr:Spiroplasmavirus-related protein [Spiroplasma kunkelii CR2-3x]